MRKYMFGILAVIAGISLSAFTVQKTNKPVMDYVWFAVNTSGVIQNPTGGVYDDEPPAVLNCQIDAVDYCAFGYNTSDATNNGNGTWTINSEGGGFTHLDGRDDQRLKN